MPYNDEPLVPHGCATGIVLVLVFFLAFIIYQLLRAV